MCAAGPAIETDAVFNQHGRRACGFQEWEVPPISQERNLAAFGVLDAGDAANFGVGRAFQAASKLLRNFSKFHG